MPAPNFCTAPWARGQGHAVGWVFPWWGYGFCGLPKQRVWKWRYSVNFCSKDLESGRIAWFFVQRKNLDSGGVRCVCFNHDQKNIPKFGRVAPKLLSPEIYISTMLVNTRHWGLKDGDCLARRLLAQSLGLWILLPKTDILENLQRIMGKSPTSGSIFAGVPCFKQAPCLLHSAQPNKKDKKHQTPATLRHLWVVETRPSSLSLGRRRQPQPTTNNQRPSSINFLVVNNQQPTSKKQPITIFIIYNMLLTLKLYSTCKKNCSVAKFWT